MLEGFFKIYSKILANRIQKPLRQIQNEQQFGFTKNKVCLEASRTVIDVILHAKRNHLPLIIISTDFYKAFDSIAHCHIQACLEVFQFPSCFTFNLVVVPLNHYLATSTDVPRYEINGVGVEPVMFADDNLMLLQGDKIELILQMLVKIGQYRFVAGLILNLVKCEIMALNCHAPDIERIVQQTGMHHHIIKYVSK